MSTTPVALTLNAGSSSLKFGLYDIAAAPVEMAMGLIENIGKAPRLKVHFGPGRTPVSRDLAATDAADHRSALATALDLLRAQFPDARASAVGHRALDRAAHRVHDAQLHI